MAGASIKTEKRTGERRPLALDLSVEGAGGAYAGQTVDISRSGALLWITDERFIAPDAAANMVQFSERVAQEFGEAMRVSFEAGTRTIDAEVVRVTRKDADDKAPMLVACRFAEILDAEEARRVGLEPARGLNGAAEPAPFEERRGHKRVETILYAEVQGDYGTFRAYALNVSASGVLLTLTDPQFATPAEPDQLMLFTKRIGFHFRAGMFIRFLEAGLTMEADVTRVSERIEGSEMLIVIGARFKQELSPDERRALQIGEPAGGPAPSAARGAFQLERSSGVLQTRPPQTRIVGYMRQAVEINASDVHIKVGSPARMRVAGELMDINADIVTPDEAHEMAVDLMTPVLAQRLNDESDVEFAYAIEGVGRFRACAFKQRGYTGLAVRTIPEHIPTFDELGLTPIARSLADRPRGLVLVTGPTGSGKSHTLAAMIHHINQTRSCHILTMEDPIEFIHCDDRAHITQREIGRDCDGFARALKRALRQDPDVILVGEMRDLETISLALTAAETGHLVFATLHTTSASKTPDRIIDVFPPAQQGQIRQQLADTLGGIMAQILVPRADGQGLALAQEVLVANDAARATIREAKSGQLNNIMQTSARDGMTTLENSLNSLVAEGVVTYEVAVAKANIPSQILADTRRRRTDRR